jgi:hypothetical protein
MLVAELCKEWLLLDRVQEWHGCTQAGTLTNMHAAADELGLPCHCHTTAYLTKPCIRFPTTRGGACCRMWTCWWAPGR